ncbi:hypothetical protein EDB81DRAFT_764742 [Dactylonectria macrodidyma]|uniref:Uncharacterized protein n=1 Tax=Dactylonectria macrodidyma TaxID=307937 RepID=A0A9P9IPA3_9HYPO|nr:hypothetical protein EDB81DRAFT_764742 [Dactylonectria macrodidyma]
MESTSNSSGFTSPRFLPTIQQHGPADLASVSGYEADSEPEGHDLDDVSLSGDDDYIVGGGADEAWEVDMLPPGYRRRRAMSLPAAINGAHDKLPELPKREFSFDDADMVNVPSEKEEDTTRTFVIPFGPRVQVNYDNYTEEQRCPRTARAKALARRIPGARQVEDATIAVASASKALQANVKEAYATVSCHLAGPASLGLEVGICTAQIGGYLAGEAWNAAKNVSVAVQEGFPEVVQPLRDGVEAVSEVLAEGMRALPHDQVLGRGRFRQRRI